MLSDPGDLSGSRNPTGGERALEEGGTSSEESPPGGGQEESAAFERWDQIVAPRCIQCHAWLEPRSTVRSLTPPHNFIDLAHGGERLWCHDCHDLFDKERLRIGRGVTVDWEEADRSCALCHGRAVRAWTHGVHGRRVGSWRGPRVILRCAECHDPHNPAFPAVAPESPPPRNRWERPREASSGAQSPFSPNRPTMANQPAVGEGS